MKGLTLLISLYLVCSSSVYGDKNLALDEYISQNKQHQFKYDYTKNKAQYKLLRDSWIAPLNLSYSYIRSNPSDDVQTNQSAAIKMDQPIFQSGGIYFGIKYANALKKYSDFSVDMAKRKITKATISLLMQIKKTELNIKRQKLQIRNADINLIQKKEQYLNGQLDSGFLDKAIIERNSVIQRLYDIQTAKERLVTNFATFSDLNYADAKIPHLELLTKKEFLNHNVALKISKSSIEKERYSKYMTYSKYLPRVSLIAGYNWNKSENVFVQVANQKVDSSSEVDYYNYGFRISMPININTFDDIEQSRVVYLKSKLQENEQKVQVAALFEQVIQNIQNLEQKKVLSLENIELYSKLLEDTKVLHQAGYKTSYDVELLQNSADISQLDAKIFEIDKQLELLNLYEMYIDEI